MMIKKNNKKDDEGEEDGDADGDDDGGVVVVSWADKGLTTTTIHPSHVSFPPAHTTRLSPPPHCF